jgi:hypothetical protein
VCISRRTPALRHGTEFHGYAVTEQATPARFYSATPHHAWERGTNENTNGLLRQYLPKRRSMAHLTQQDCEGIAAQLNRRPRKRLGCRTPEECYTRGDSVLQFKVDIKQPLANAALEAHDTSIAVTPCYQHGSCPTMCALLDTGPRNDNPARDEVCARHIARTRR